MHKVIEKLQFHSFAHRASIVQQRYSLHVFHKCPIKIFQTSHTELEDLENLHVLKMFFKYTRYKQFQMLYKIPHA